MQLGYLGYRLNQGLSVVSSTFFIVTGIATVDSGDFSDSKIIVVYGKTSCGTKKLLSIEVEGILNPSFIAM